LGIRTHANRQWLPSHAVSCENLPASGDIPKITVTTSEFGVPWDDEYCRLFHDAQNVDDPLFSFLWYTVVFFTASEYKKHIACKRPSSAAPCIMHAAR
jgi:hypothetical protein